MVGSGYKFRSKRIVVKVGSSTLVDVERGEVKEDWLRGFSEDVRDLRERGHEILVVSSGAVVLGWERVVKGGEVRKGMIETQQASASVGQIILGGEWMRVMGLYGIDVGMLLLTIDDTEERERHLNVRGTLTELLKRDIVPVVNENDTVATQRLRFGDNDRLAARIATMMGAGELVVLSDVDGLYAGDPRASGSYHIPVVEEVSEDVERLAGGPRGLHARGGMASKVRAAKDCMEGGCSLVLTRGDVKNPLKTLEGGGRHTLFLSRVKPRTARKNWLSGMVNCEGSLEVDEGAEVALRRGKSLLPSGVVGVRGNFLRGDAVGVCDRRGKVLGVGLSAYGSEEARKLMGHRSGEIEEILGYKHAEELVHRDDLALMRSGVGL